jgi:hypothetical protein
MTYARLSARMPARMPAQSARQCKTSMISSCSQGVFALPPLTPLRLQARMSRAAALDQGSKMTGKRIAKTAKKTPTVVTYNVADLKGEKKDMGGGMHDMWNDVLAGQAIAALWTGNSGPEDRNKQFVATVAALHGIKPRDELEGMLAASRDAARADVCRPQRGSESGKQAFKKLCHAPGCAE